MDESGGTFHHGVTLPIPNEILQSLTEHENTEGPMKAQSNTRSFFLETMPLEIRKSIYRLLLVNDAVTTIAYVDPNLSYPDTDWVDFSTPYHLTPAVLRVCRQVYEEALPVLYGENIFTINMTRNFTLTKRYLSSRFKYYLDIERLVKSQKFPNVQKIKRWRLDLESATTATGSAHEDDQKIISQGNKLRSFCLFLREYSPVQLIVQIVGQAKFPKQDYCFFRGSRCPQALIDKWYTPTGRLAPLERLSGVGELLFIEGPDARFSDVFTFKSEIGNGETPPEALQRLKSHVQGPPREMVTFKTYNNILRYAQTFERDPTMSSFMDVPWNEAHAMLGSPDYPFIAYTVLPDPYFHHPVHPVEMNLIESCTAYIDNDVELFRSARQRVFDYLEPQYQRIVKAADNMAYFLKSVNLAAKDSCPLQNIVTLLRYGLYWPSSNVLVNRAIDQVMMILEEYANSFVRDVPPATKLAIRQLASRDGDRYLSSDRDRRLAVLQSLLKHGSGLEKPGAFLSHIEAIVQDMDRQYLDIRAARKTLFFSGDSLDPETWRSDEAINFQANGPFIGPWTQEEAEAGKLDPQRMYEDWPGPPGRDEY